MTNHIERKIANSFRLVKTDIQNLNERVKKLEDKLNPEEPHSVIIPTIKSSKRVKRKKSKRK